MKSVQQFKLIWLIALLVLAACAPADLDITPSPTPTAAPSPTSTPNAASTATEEATPEVEAVSEKRLLLDYILANLPNSIPGANTQWRPTSDPIQYRDRDGGVTGMVTMTEGGGGLTELTIGVFDTPEAALAHWESRRDGLRTLEHAEERDGFPKPNAFGSGTYGSAAIWTQGNVFVWLSIPRFPGNEDPLGPFGLQLVNIIEAEVASYESSS